LAKVNDIKKPAIEVSSLSYTYQEGTKALSGIDLTVDEGGFVALLASNGSGKTTLIRTLAGLAKPQEGKISICGDDIADLKEKDLYQRIGVAFQNPDDQLFAATVGEDVAFGPRNLGLEEAEVEARVAESLSMVSVEELRGKAIHHLSFGQKKRVALAGVLAMRPSVVLLDEPTMGLDPEAEASLMTLLKEINSKRGTTVVMATHSIDMLPLFADYIYILRRGTVLRRGTAQDILTDHEMLLQAGLRLPYVSSLLHQMKLHDGLPVKGLPLTIGEARKDFLALIPEDILIKPLTGDKV